MDLDGESIADLILAFEVLVLDLDGLNAMVCDLTLCVLSSQR